MAENEHALGKNPNVHRRSVLKAAAWATPVIAVAASAPAMAVSVPVNPPLPPRYFSQDIRLAQDRVDGVIDVLKVVDGFAVFEGSPGQTAGFAVVRIVVPAGYTWNPDSTLTGWTVVEDVTASGKARYSYRSSEELLIAPGENTIRVNFAGGRLLGDGSASTDNQARLYTGTSLYQGIDSQFPAADE